MHQTSAKVGPYIDRIDSEQKPVYYLPEGALF